MYVYEKQFKNFYICIPLSSFLMGLNKKFFKKRKDDNKKIAKQRIKSLLEFATVMFSKDSALSNRYITLTNKISSKFRVSLPFSQKRLFCKKCKVYLRPSVNSRVRVRKGLIVQYCMNCKTYNRKSYK